MSNPNWSRSIVAWTVFAMAMVMAIIAGGLWAVNASSAAGVFPPQIFVVPGFGLVGAIVTSRSRNNIGPLFLALAVVGAGTALTFEYAVRAVGTAPGSLPMGAYAAAFSSAGFPFTFLALGLTLVLFPDGRLPSPRWRVPTWCFTLVWSLLTFLSLLIPTLVLGPFSIHNPIGVGGITILVDPESNPIASAAFGVLGFLLLAVMATAPIFRRRHAQAELRQQLHWFALVLEAILVLVLIVSALAVPFHADTGVAVVSVAILGLVALGIPAAIGIAVMKYRLYDLDVVISKTIVYGLLAVFIGAVYVAIVVGVSAVIPVGSDSALLSIAATGLVALTFQPVRERVERFANRLVYGERSTPYEVLTRFSDRVANTYASEDVLPRTARVIAEGVNAARATIWLHLADQLQPAAGWPDIAPGTAPVPLRTGLEEELPPLPGAHVAGVRYQGQLLGAIAIEKRQSEPLTPEEVKLVDDLAAQAGLVVSNARLTADLEARLSVIARQAAELRAARQRIVAAQDAERRRLERNIHDGAQQHLVALAVKLRLSRGLFGKDPAKAGALLVEIREETGEAIDTLKDLSRGIYPALLEERGIAAALAAQYARSEIPVRLSSGADRRYPIEIEAAIYFSCLEALQNASKYARATSVEIQLDEGDSSVGFEVRDDGVGFDPAATPRGTGLNSIADRLAVLGGDVEIGSAPGGGTTVRGRLPLGAAEALS